MPLPLELIGRRDNDRRRSRLGDIICRLASTNEGELFVQREKHRLAARHHEFIEDMASRTVYGREPTPKQHQYLHSLFYKLGGKITS